MNEFEKAKLLVNISRLYYEHNYSQQEISKKFGLSRTYISKLLYEAREKGIVEIRINDPVKFESETEEQLRKKLGLQKAIIIPTSDSDPALLDKLGAAAAEYLNLIIQDHDTIGVAWGETLYAFSHCIVQRSDLKKIRVVQVCGGISKMQKNIYVIDIPKNIAAALNGNYDLIPLPAVLESPAAKNAVAKDKSVNAILSLAKKSNIALFTAGAFQDESSFLGSGYFSAEDFERLKKENAVGDLCSHIIDTNGDLCDMQLERRTVALSLDEIISIPTKMCIAAGKHKIGSILAAVKIGCINVLVTTEQTATQLLK